MTDDEKWLANHGFVERNGEWEISNNHGVMITIRLEKSVIGYIDDILWHAYIDDNIMGADHDQTMVISDVTAEGCFMKLSSIIASVFMISCNVIGLHNEEMN